jgi:hypothetical protein
MPSASGVVDGNHGNQASQVLKQPMYHHRLEVRYIKKKRHRFTTQTQSLSRTGLQKEGIDSGDSIKTDAVNLIKHCFVLFVCPRHHLFV